MKLTIIPIDGTVQKDGLAYLKLYWIGTPENVHALQWQDTEGWIEFNDGTLNKTITKLPNWTDNALSAWDIANNPIPVPPTIDNNKDSASLLLSSTDWVTLLDVIDVNINPHLLNQSEFLNYRTSLRNIVVNPVEGDIQWPILPKAKWSSNI